MIRNLDYLRPESLTEALEILERHGPEAKVLAGGTNLIVYFKDGSLKPGLVLDVKRLPELLSPLSLDQGLTLSPLATMSRLEGLTTPWTNLAAAAGQMGSPLVRHRATVGGNICDASPAADTAVALLSYETSLSLVRAGGRRRLPLEEFFLGPRRTARAPDEILAALHLAPPPPHTGQAFLKLGRRKALQIALVSVAVSLNRDKAGSERILSARIALGSVAPTPLRARRAERVLAGQAFGPAVVAAAAEAAVAEARPIDDHRASAEYRRDMIAVLVTRALNQAWLDSAGIKEAQP